MSSGAAHAAAGVVLGAVGTGAALVACGLGYLPAAYMPCAVAGWWVGVLVTPDADMIQRTHEEARMARIPLVGWLWRAIWLPYALAIPHRSVWSHGLIVGTVGRALYLGLLIAVGAWALGKTLTPNWWAIVWLAPGWVAQDALHAIMEW